MEDWKNALCIYRYSQLSDMEALLKGYALKATLQSDKLDKFIEEYRGVMSLTYMSSHNDLINNMKKLSNRISGMVVKVTSGGKPTK